MYCNMLTLILNDLLCMDCDVKQTNKKYKKKTHFFGCAFPLPIVSPRPNFYYPYPP